MEKIIYMLSRKSIFFLRILTLSFTVVLCFPWTAMAQFVEQRLIPLSDMAETHPSQNFVVYGRACKGHPPIPLPSDWEDIRDCSHYTGDGAYDAGILPTVLYYRHIPNSQSDIPRDLNRMPNLEAFFEYGGTLELLTKDRTLHKYDLVISELMWGIDRALRDTESTITIPNRDHNPNIPTDHNNREFITLIVPHIRNQETQWIELYNTTDREITAELYFLFTPFRSYPVRENDTVMVDGDPYKVLDAVDTLFTGLWRLPGASGRRPTTAFVSAYRNINYEIVEDTSLGRRTQLSGIPFGSNPDSWEATPDSGRRNTRLSVYVPGPQTIELPCIATPGTKHVSGAFVGRLDRLPVRSDLVVINEVRNDTSTDNVDWLELKNISARAVQIEGWELSIVTGVGKDNDLVDLPKYELHPGEILLLLNKEPWSTSIIDGVNIGEYTQRLTRPSHSYFVDERLNLPNTGRYLLLLRSESDQNGKDRAIEDYAGNGFFIDTSSNFSTGFWPRVGQQVPTNVADFGANSFASRHNAWARIRYQKDDGHHKDAWEEIGAQGGLGYDPDADFSTSPGTPGYENDALKARPDDGNFRTLTTEHELTDGQISISEIMYDPSPNRNRVQWIELYNSSLTQAVNIKGWVLEIHNIRDDEGSYVNENLTFNEAIILPNHTLLLVSKRASNSVLLNRVYDLNRQHRNELNLTGQNRLLLLNPNGFYLRLRTEPTLRFGNSVVVDEVGNIGGRRGNLIKLWELPEPRPERRQSIVRQYGTPFRPEQGISEVNPGVPSDGTQVVGWRKASGSHVGETYYGDKKDLSTPGHRRGSPLPVELSSFRPVRMETGEVLIKWITESELNNAGFNILRSESRNSDFDVVNLKGIIPGHGTSSEQHIYAYTDTTAKPNIIYYYRIEDVSFDGVRQTIATVRLKGDVSASGKLTTTWSSLKTQN